MHLLAPSNLLLLLALAQRAVSSPRQDGQAVLTSPDLFAVSDLFADAHGDHIVDDTILAALNAHPDPVDALISLQPELAAQLAERRLLHVFGQAEPQWMTEGDKLHLRRAGKQFMDITDHQELYTDSLSTLAGKPSP